MSVRKTSFKFSIFGDSSSNTNNKIKNIAPRYSFPFKLSNNSLELQT